MRIHMYRHLIISFGILIYGQVAAQDESFIYGKVYTEDGQNYVGPIRWGKEEIYWTDIFNAAKERNDNIRFLSDKEKEDLDEKHAEWFSWDNHFSSWFGTKHWYRDSDDDYIHQFSCQFGEIKTVTPLSRKYVELELKNGQKFEVSGEGYNDVGLDIRVTDQELGHVEIEWGRIEKIEFMDTPAKLDQKFGQPLFGTVEAFGDKFTGYIQWDHDERITTDKLDGDSDDGDLSIEFSKIRSIERKGNQSLVILKSGREVWMSGTNDVGSGHRGVIVENKEFPSIDIPWREFDKVVFDDKQPSAIASYKDFGAQQELFGKITTLDGKSLSGRLVYDLDETHNYELLQGKEGEFEFTTPFRNIKRIITNGEHRCTIELRTGKKITLDDAQDVDEKNQGVLVFDKEKSDPRYIPWDEIKEIEFR